MVNFRLLPLPIQRQPETHASRNPSGSPGHSSKLRPVTRFETRFESGFAAGHRAGLPGAEVTAMI